MALSLPGERSLEAASPAHPLAKFGRWIAQAKAARSRQIALQALLHLDSPRLQDLGISRQDVTNALAGRRAAPGRVLNAARARNALGWRP